MHFDCTTILLLVVPLWASTLVTSDVVGTNSTEFTPLQFAFLSLLLDVRCNLLRVFFKTASHGIRSCNYDGAHSSFPTNPLHPDFVQRSSPCGIL